MKVFIFVLSLLYIMRFIVTIINKIILKDFTPVKINNYDTILIYFSLAYIITVLYNS